jgi:ribosomal protein S18 acetylase RimI-like enzyme
VHAGFGVSADDSALDTDLGVTCMLMTLPDHRLGEITHCQLGTQLLEHSEAYLRSQGAQVLYAGGIQPLNPFYFSLYGGSELPGVLSSDHRALDAFQAGGYREIDQVAILNRELRGFRAPIDRRQMAVRRQYEVSVDPEPPYGAWWDACNYAHLARTLITLRRKSDGAEVGIADYWNMDTMAAHWGVRAVGLSRLEIDSEELRQGLGTFLVAEVLKHAQGEGATLVEVQTMQSNSAALALYTKLGFQQVDQGLVLRKEG